MSLLGTSSARASASFACDCICRCSTRSASTASHRTRPPKTWTLPNFQLAKKSHDLPSARPQRFESKISLPNDGSMSIYSTCPRPSIAITRDTSNHPLWAFPSAANTRSTTGPNEDEGDRMGRFARKFGEKQQTEVHASMSQGQVNLVEDISERAGGSSRTDVAAEAARTVMRQDVKGEFQPRTTGKQAAQSQTAKKEADAEHSSKHAEARAKEAEAEQKADEQAQDYEMFDLELQGEVYEESKHKIVEEGGKKKAKGKKGGGKK